MSWQHIFIPVLPAQLMDYLSAPMPFLIGVPEPIMRRVRHTTELGEVVILDADNNRVDTPFADLESLPSEVVSNLKKSLKSPGQMLGDSVARAFLQALVHLIGGYRDGLKYRSGDKITFNEEAFVRSRSSSIQPFLEKMLQLQIFRQFIEERLDLLNSGRGFSDEFELECVAFTDKANKRLKNQYAAITQNVRKESGAFVKAVKSKANPAVKDAVKTVKEGSKIAQHRAKATYKDFKSRLRENREEIRNEDVDNNGGGANTHSAPSSPVQSRSSTALDRYGTMTSGQFQRQNTDLNFSRVRKYERFDPSMSHKELSPDFEDLPRLEYDLMSDLEEVMSRGKAEVGLPHRNGAGTSTYTAHAPLAIHHTKTAASTPPQLDRPPPLASSEKGSVAHNSVRKASVGDLINLEAEEDTELEIIFDPLAVDLPPTHRKLSRTGGGHNPFSSTAVPDPAPPTNRMPLNSFGKYENYTPPAGNSQTQFKQFLSSMTVETPPQRPSAGGAITASAAAVRSSDDLLSEYGIHFGGLALNRQAVSSGHSLLSDPVVSTQPATVPPPLYSRPSGFPSPSVPPTPAIPLPPPRTVMSVRPATNSSFLYSSSQAFAASDFFASSSDPTGAMPVNQRIRSLPGGDGGVGDILADLDPLRALPAAAAVPRHQHPVDAELASGIRPPTVPPRVKKAQWTTFE